MCKFLRVSMVLVASFLALFPTSLAAQTDLGTVAIASSNSATVTVTLLSTAKLGSISVRTKGVENLDFTNAGGGTCSLGTAYAANATCTVQISFKPSRPGVRVGAVVLMDETGSVVATSYLKGFGTGPMINFPSTPESLIGTFPSTHFGLAVDEGGNIFLANMSDGLVLKETLTGGKYIETTIASGFNSPQGLALDGAGNLYVSDTFGSRVVKETLSASGYSESLVTSNVTAPWGLTVDDTGNIYIVDWLDTDILKETWSPTGYAESVIAHCPQIYYGTCTGVAVDKSGNLYVLSQWVGYVLRETPSADGYKESRFNAGLQNAYGIVINGLGDLYIADTQNLRVVKIALSQRSLTPETVAISTPVFFAYGIAIDGSGDLYLSGGYQNQLWKKAFSVPPNLSFAATDVGSTSSDSPQTVTVQNEGNSALVFPIPTTGSNASISTNFSLDSSAAGACPVVESSATSAASLKAGQTCQFTISYKPTDGGIFRGSLVMTDNDLNIKAPNFANQTIALSEAGVQNAASQTVLQVSPNSVVGDQSFTFTATVTGTPGGAKPTGNVSFTGLGNGVYDAVLDKNGVASVFILNHPVGKYSIVATYQGDRTYQASLSQPSTLTVSTGPASAILGWFLSTNLPPLGIPYGYPPIQFGVRVSDAGGNPVPGLTVNFSGPGIQFTNNPGYSVPPVTDATGIAIIQVQALKPGALTIYASVAGTSVQGSYAFNVLPAPLTVTLHNNWRDFGDSNPTLTSTMTGLVGSDSATVNPQTTAGKTSPVGDYPITATVSGPDASKYVATIIPATLQVRKARLNVTATGYSSQYGQTPAQPTAYSFFGFMNGDAASVVSGSPTLSTAVTSTTQVGYYPFSIGVGTLSASNYYLVPFTVHSVLHVTKAPLTVNADHITMHRGHPIPALTYTLSGFVNGETASVVTGAPIVWTYARSSTSPGTYPIYISTGSLKAHDYSMNGVSGTLTILP